MPGSKPASSNCECKLMAFDRLPDPPPPPDEDPGAPALISTPAGGGESRSRGGVTCCRGSSKFGSITSKNTYGIEHQRAKRA